MANERRRMGGPRGGQMPVEKAKDFKGSIGKLFVYMKKYHAAVVVDPVCSCHHFVQRHWPGYPGKGDHRAGKRSDGEDPGNRRH